MASSGHTRRWLVADSNAWASDHSGGAEVSSVPISSLLVQRIPPTRLNPDNTLKRKTWDDITVEELPDLEDAGYDADIEIRRPDEYDEAGSEQASPGKSEPGGDLNDDDDGQDDDDLSDDGFTTESRIVEKLRRLNCDPVEMARRTKYRRSFRPVRRRNRGNSLKRSFSQSLGSGSDLEDTESILIDNILMETRRQRRRVEARRSKFRSEDGFPHASEAQNPENATLGATVSSSSDSAQPAERMFTVGGIAEAMDVDSQGSNLEI